MIELIHKYPILIKILLTVTTVAFVATGGYFMGQDTVEYAASVEGEKITMQEYQDAVYNLEDFYRKIYQGNVPEDLFRNLNLGKAALDQLIDRKAVLVAADRMDLEVGDEEVAEAVRKSPSFLDQDGNFSKSVYVEVLKYNNMTPKAFEISLRQDLTVEKFNKMVHDSVKVTEDDVRQFFKEQRESQGMEFEEQAYQDNKESMSATLENINREKALRSVVENLKAEMDIEINPKVAQGAG